MLIVRSSCPPIENRRESSLSRPYKILIVWPSNGKSSLSGLPTKNPYCLARIKNPNCLALQWRILIVWSSRRESLLFGPLTENPHCLVLIESLLSGLPIEIPSCVILQNLQQKIILIEYSLLYTKQ